MIRKLLIFLGLMGYLWSYAGNGYDLLPNYVSTLKSNDVFPIVADGNAATILIDSDDWKGVVRAAGDLARDIELVTSKSVLINRPSASHAIIIGTIGKSKYIHNLIKSGKLDVKDIEGQWESFVIQTIDGNLVIAGSDKRGTIYGIYDMSEKIGVSPWHYWADVPVKKSSELYVANGRYLQPSPAVKYRGIFINDEWPSFGGWATQRFGGINSKMYSTMFELLLRLKANYLWPAMWGSAFNEDDPLNPQLADEYGIVMGTSHHEPMMRAHKEYTRRRDEVGPWNYNTNKERIDSFFYYGIERNKDYENIITIGMRGDGDTPMGNGDDRANIQTLKNVIATQRDIIGKVYGKEPSKLPQMLVAFGEVQRYFEAGLDIPDDVTLMFCDNNWGQLRRIGPKNERKRKGGMGLYYHIDMNGGPANDRWINTITAAKIREQLNLAYQTGLDRVWLVNVGDLKPKEMPIDFIMRYAWNPDSIGLNDIDDFMIAWASEIFGSKHAVEIADIVDLYSHYNLLRKPEVQNPKVMSVVNYNEADRIVDAWKSLAQRAKRLSYDIDPEYRDAYYQLVLYPVVASAGVAEIYVCAGKNNLYASQGRASANDYADRAKVLFEEDKLLTDHYNNCISNGKWKNMMLDNHIGYTSWSMPKKNILPRLDSVVVSQKPEMGIGIEGCEKAWPKNSSLPIFEPCGQESYYIDIFNKGAEVFEFSASTETPWINLSASRGMVDKEFRLNVSINWDIAPQGKHNGVITITDGNNTASIDVPVYNYALPKKESHYYAGCSEFSIPAHDFNRNIAGKYASWTFAPKLGRGTGAMLIDCVTAPSAEKHKNAPRLEYDFYLPDDTLLTVVLAILPTQDIYPARGLRMAVAVDDNALVMVDMRKGMSHTAKEYAPEALTLSKVLKPLPQHNSKLALAGFGKPRRSDVLDGMRWVDINLGDIRKGLHTLKIYMVDPEIVLDKIVINPDNLRPSYLGAPPKRINPL